MSLKIEIEELQAILIEAGLDQTQRAKIIKLANDEAEAKKAEKEAEKEEEGTKGKYRFVVLIRGSEEVKKVLEGAGCFLAQVLEENDGTKLQTDLITSAARQNEKLSARKPNSKGRKSKGSKINSWVELFNWLKPKVLNEVTNKSVKIKSKVPVEIQVLEHEDIQFSK